ncbi:threonylcarbamoyl-AMP synthase [bacterium K02(2017)]|nr:threonylcarbamoyl-AMP synthase [bacterium K02(2017)]
MKRISIHPVNPQARLVKQVASVLEEGGLVIFPTGAGYSVGCTANSKKAIHRLYHLKRSVKKYNMALMVSDFSIVTHYAVVETSSYRYMKDKLPGPYTFILPATKEGKKLLDVKRKEIGIRMPKHPFYDTLSELFNEPILNTAAKLHDDDMFEHPDDIEEKFGKQVEMIVDIGEVPLSPTTIISMVNKEPELIREGEGVF